MKDSWKYCTVGDFEVKGEAELKTGPFGTQIKASEYVESGVPMINARNIGFREVRSEKLEYLSEETVARLSSHLLKPGDIVFGRKGSVERHVLIAAQHNRWFQGTDCLRLRMMSSSVDNSFLSYSFLLNDHQRWMMNQSSHGATMTSLNQDIIRRIPLRLPPLPVQQRIAGILSAYDELIENSQRRIRILEEMARALYREWFVHFRFPGHENVPLVPSSLGDIPQGWEVKPFTEVADVLSGGTPKTNVAEYWNGKIPFYTPRDAPGCFYVQETDKHVTELGLVKCASQLYPPDTVFITARGTVGKVALPSLPMAMNQSCYALRGKLGVPQRFLFLMTLQQVEYLKTNTGGATFDTIVVDTFRRMEVVKPSIEIISYFARQTDAIFEQVKTLQRQITNLCQTRDLLLPRLLSGQIVMNND